MSPPSKLERVSKRKIQKRRHKKTDNRTTKNTHNGGGAATEPIPVNEADFSLSLSNHVISTFAKDKNLVISPLSIRVLLGLVAAGSNGPTRDQLLGFLKSDTVEELNSFSSNLVTHVFADGEPLGGPRLSIANGVWIDRSLRLKPSFEEIVHSSYMAASDHVDFRTKADKVRKKVNAWAEKETNGLIKDLLPPGSVDYMTRLIVANAVYFKGAWLDKFDTSHTKDDKFFLLDGSTVKVPFMTDRRMQYVRAFDGFKVLRLPYKQGKDKRKFSMYFFLPDAKDGLPALLERAGSECGFIESHLPEYKVSVRRFRIPKFKIGFEFEASRILAGLGVVLPFRMGGLTEMVDSDIDGKELYVSGIFQKAFVEVNEQGTEAAAASALRMMGGCMRNSVKIIEYVDFVADHPFMFVIREDVSGVVLFVGQLLNPNC
ncbi:hypothetical protein ABFX02_03G049900 [Erythranthe guttata]